MDIVISYKLLRIAALIATAALVSLSLLGVHPAFAGDPTGPVPH